jgi:thiamine-phosphate pyrophosphorylase
MKPLDQCRLYAFVDTGYLGGRAPDRIAQELCDGGADLIQLRAKGASREELRRLAESILPVTRRAEVGLVINDECEVARGTGAEFCHLGQEDFFGAGFRHVEEVSGARRPEPGAKGQLRIGLSTHSPEQARRAVAAGADYIAIGPVYATGTKPQAKPVTLRFVHWAAAHVSIPWFAIGGIQASNLDAVLAAGARRICMVSGILAANDVTKACAVIRKRLDQAI